MAGSHKCPTDTNKLGDNLLQMSCLQLRSPRCQLWPRQTGARRLGSRPAEGSHLQLVQPHVSLTSCPPPRPRLLRCLGKRLPAGPSPLLSPELPRNTGGEPSHGIMPPVGRREPQPSFPGQRSLESSTPFPVDPSLVKPGLLTAVASMLCLKGRKRAVFHGRPALGQLTKREGFLFFGFFFLKSFSTFKKLPLSRAHS